MPKAADDRPKVSFRRRYARFVGKLAVVLVIAVWGVQEVWGESHWFTVYVTYAPPILYLAIPAVALALALLCLDRNAVVWSLVAGGLCLVSVARPSVPLSRPKAPPARTLRIVTWNVHNREDRVGDIRAELRRLDPDIVCLQEANSRRFGECWPGADSAGADSLLTLTHGEIESREAIRPAGKSHYLRPLLETDLSVDGMRLKVLNVHLYSYQLAEALKNPSKEEARELTQGAVAIRALQIERMGEWIEAQTGPAIVAGDFNTPPRGRLYGGLADLATDAFAATGTGFGWTFPSHHPILRIDYVWLTAGVKPVRCWRPRIGPSDHLPVVADLVVP